MKHCLVLKDVGSPAAMVPADRQRHMNPLDRDTNEVQSKSQWIKEKPLKVKTATLGLNVEKKVRRRWQKTERNTVLGGSILSAVEG